MNYGKEYVYVLKFNMWLFTRIQQKYDLVNALKFNTYSYLKMFRTQNIIVLVVSSPIVCPQSPSIVPVMVTVRELGVVALSMGVLALASKWFQADM